MPTVTATPCNDEVKMTKYTQTQSITDDLHPAVIGECVTRAVRLAWADGYDPAQDDFSVLVKFT